MHRKKVTKAVTAAWATAELVISKGALTPCFHALVLRYALHRSVVTHDEAHGKEVWAPMDHVRPGAAAGEGGEPSSALSLQHSPHRTAYGRGRTACLRKQRPTASSYEAVRPCTY